MPLEKEENIFAKLEELVKKQQIIGEPYRIEDMIFVPVIDTMIGCGIGTKKNTAGGGGAYLNPKAIIVIKPTGEVSLLSLETDSSSDKIKERMPEILGQLEDLIEK